MAQLVQLLLIFLLSNNRRVPPHDGVVGKIPRRAALAVVPVGLAVDGVQAQRVLRRSLRAAQAGDAAGGRRAGRARDEASAVGRMLERPSAGFVVHVLLALHAIPKGDLGGGQNQPHPRGQFFESVSSASAPSASNPAMAA